jgi:hypothetical protein
VLREQTWLLGPSGADADSAARRMLRFFSVPESKQQIFQSHSAALEEAKRDNGVAIAVTFAVADDIRHGRLMQLAVRGGQLEGCRYPPTPSSRWRPSCCASSPPPGRPRPCSTGPPPPWAASAPRYT